jgi:UPF0755 protein
MKKSVLGILLVGILALIIILWNVFGGTVHAPEKKFFFIKNGATYEEIKANLEKENIVKPGFFFNTLMSQANYKDNIKPGRYEIKDGTSIYALIKMLKSGKQAAVKLVINKLRTREDLAGKIGNNFECDSLQAINFLNNNDSILSFGLDTNKIMSAIIPNTYEINYGSSMRSILTKLKAEQDKFWNEQRIAKASAKKLTPMQVYILASIVEEETNATSDKPIIASVYKNRLQTGQKLQADPTVKFAMKNFAAKRIYLKNLEYPSPYNTYKNVGLPPGPICTPSVKTIDAVLDAAETNYMFFVAKPDLKGYSNFAVTYAEHLVFAKQYQDALNERIKNTTK